MKNPKWYKFNESEMRYELTEDAPPDAKKSYEEYYLLLDEGRHNGN